MEMEAVYYDASGVILVKEWVNVARETERGFITLTPGDLLLSSVNGRCRHLTSEVHVPSCYLLNTARRWRWS